VRIKLLIGLFLAFSIADQANATNTTEPFKAYVDCYGGFYKLLPTSNAYFSKTKDEALITFIGTRFSEEVLYFFTKDSISYSQLHDFEWNIEKSERIGFSGANYFYSYPKRIALSSSQNLSMIVYAEIKTGTPSRYIKDSKFKNFLKLDHASLMTDQSEDASSSVDLISPFVVKDRYDSQAKEAFLAAIIEQAKQAAWGLSLKDIAQEKKSDKLKMQINALEKKIDLFIEQVNNQMSDIEIARVEKRLFTLTQEKAALSAQVNELNNKKTPIQVAFKTAANRCLNLEDLHLPLDIIDNFKDELTIIKNQLTQ